MTAIGRPRQHRASKHKVVPRNVLYPGEAAEADRRGIDIDTPVHEGKIPRIKAALQGPMPVVKAPILGPETAGEALSRAISQFRADRVGASPEVLTPPLSRSVGVEVVPRGVFVSPTNIVAVRREDIKLGPVDHGDEDDGYLPYPGDKTDDQLAQAGAA